MRQQMVGKLAEAPQIQPEHLAVVGVQMAALSAAKLQLLVAQLAEHQ